MGKTGKWFKNFLSGKKEKGSKHEKKLLVDDSNNGNNGSTTGGGGGKDDTIPPPPPPPVVGVVPLPRPTTPKDKKRWSFRRSSATAPNSKELSSAVVVSNGNGNSNSTVALSEPEPETKPEELDENKEKPSLVVEVAVDDDDNDNDTTEMDARRECVIEVAAAVRIQCVFRSYLARKALKALRGLVKLQALVRGHLVRKQATATLRCMQALVTAQARARAQRIRTVDDGRLPVMNHRQSTHRRNSHEKIKQSYHDMEENIKIVEMDQGEYGSTHNYSIPNQQQHNFDRLDGKISTYYQQISPAPSAINDMSPRTCSGHFEDYTYATAQSSPQCYSTASRPDPSQSQPTFSFPNPEFPDTMSYEYPLYPSYMANTESSRAKARSQSAPKQRPEFERQMSRGRRPSVEGRSSIPKGARMQRSSSHVGAAEKNYHYPWSVSVKLDKSAVSLKDSECGSSCSVFTNANNYSRSLVSYDPRY